jgi:hypothetical protein
MKLKYTNFKHYASSAPEPTFVPSHMVRKHWSLITIEMYHLFASLIGFGVVIFIFNSVSFFYTLYLLTCSSSMFASSLLSIMDNYRFKVAYIFTNSVFPILLFFIAPIELAAAIATLGVLVVIAIMYLEKNKAYFEWCKSISNN